MIETWNEIVRYLDTLHIRHWQPAHNQTTGGKHAVHSYHYRGTAVDLDPSPEIFHALEPLAVKGPNRVLAELFLDKPRCGFYKHGSRIGYIANHRNHLHAALEFGRRMAPPSSGRPLGASGDIAWGAKVSPEFKAKVVQLTSDLGIDPSYLMACMAFETGETFSPSKKNAAGSGATGLIQFMPDTARDLGTSTSALAHMSAVEQLNYVKKYFYNHSGKLHTLEDVYMAILYPSGIGRKANSAIFVEGTKKYTQNRGFDKNGDGLITPAEVSALVRAKYEKGLKPGFVG